MFCFNDLYNVSANHHIILLLKRIKSIVNKKVISDKNCQKFSYYSRYSCKTYCNENSDCNIPVTYLNCKELSKK